MPKSSIYSTWESQSTIVDDSDVKSQREVRARVLKLKKWIRNIELHNSHTIVMKQSLVKYTNELNELQRKRMSSNGKRIL